MENKRIKTFLVLGITIFVVIIVFLLIIKNINSVSKKRPNNGETNKNFSAELKNQTDDKESLKKAQKISRFPIKYATKLPEGYKFSKIDSWQGNTEGAYLYYKKNENEKFVIEEINSPSYSGITQEPEILKLDNGKKAYFWNIKYGNTTTKILYFDQFKGKDLTIFYTISSSTLSLGEVLFVANNTEAVK